MQTRAPWFLLLTVMTASIGFFYLAHPGDARAERLSSSSSPRSPQPQPQQSPAAQQQRIVEFVDFEGNRRLRDEDLLYYVQTRIGDPYTELRVQNDLKTLLALPFFDKVATSVSITDGPRGGVNVIFTVSELPIIRDIQFKGMSSITEADVLKEFRERRVGVSKESVYDPVKVNAAKRVIKELLAARGRPNATVDDTREEVSQTSLALTFDVKEGDRVRVVDIDFEGNQVFSDGELRGSMKYVKEAGLISRFKGQDILDTRKLEADLKGNVESYMKSKGYLQARTGEPRIEDIGERRTGFFIPLPIISSTDDALRVTVPVVEGKLYRVGEIKIEGNSILSEQDIRATIGLVPGEVANGQRLGKALYEDLKRLYGRFGFIQYEYDVTPNFKDGPQNPNEGIADFTVTITEGKQFALRRLEFIGNTFTRDNVLRREVFLNEGDIYDQSLWEYSITRLNQTGFFDPIDKEKDADFRTNEEEGLVDINLKVAERGRQQISFNGGISGIGGSFFGLDYSTNNLLGRGESLSFQFSFGNRQRSFVFSFTEPYLFDRPISVGFTLFSQSLKYFGEGTLLSQNPEAVGGVLGSAFDFLNTNEENLFTQNSLGGSIFASAPLSEFYKKRPFTRFSRVGLSYSISRTSIEDPEVNRTGDQSQFIPVVFAQPNILTSRVTPSFVYDTRDRGIDPTSGRQLALSLAFAGLGGDVRTYQPSASLIQFIPVRRKRSQNPEVFGFRFVAGHVGSFATSSRVRDAQSSSLSFINGVPIYERFFLGDEFTIRGYNVRSIGPIVPLDSFVTSRDVVVASNAAGAPVQIAGLQNLSSAGVFTGAAGSNSAPLFGRSIRFLGGDTQLLGNFEYRVPIFGPAAIAAFADIGTAFNLRSGTDQTFSTSFLGDDTFLPSTGIVNCQGVPVRATLSTIAACNRPNPLALTGNAGLIVRDGRLVTRDEFTQAVQGGAQVDPLTGLPVGFQEVFLRGQAQSNTVARISESIFSRISDYRASMGLELRVQLPVVNVPFRLIYAYNPNARTGPDETLGINFNEKKSVFRFSIGRTF